ncbi:hypothetical protein [Burkholderia cepacia]|uniref:hypothetical protein n=1 Tax=Burkholderia cepacia TaxID=292 RepID=UPI001CF1FA2E|nr:hypothetical protein [Burkholderia cepacia]MCA8348423.1 hypothetical protein [Burkholderia cepacia]
MTTVPAMTCLISLGHFKLGERPRGMPNLNNTYGDGMADKAGMIDWSFNRLLREAVGKRGTTIWFPRVVSEQRRSRLTATTFGGYRQSS